jgi:hypothetical protein
MNDLGAWHAAQETLKTHGKDAYESWAKTMIMTLFRLV